MLNLVRIALTRPYTFVVLALLILIVGPLAALRTPIDIFPEIRIPVIAVVWQYTGLPPDEMSGRVMLGFQRSLTTTVNDIEHIEGTSYTGVGIVKVFFQPGTDIRTANSQVTAIAQTVLKQMPPNITPPLILNFNASTVPIIQIALAGKGMSEQAVFDIAINTVRTPLVTVHGAAIPFPFGGKFRQIQIDLDPAAMQARGLSANDVANALAAQNLLTPVGTQKIGGFEYAIQLNNAPKEFAALADLPVFAKDGTIVYLRDVAQVRDGNPPQQNIVHVDGSRSVLLAVLKNGATSTLSIIEGIKQRADELRKTLPENVSLAMLGDQSLFVEGAVTGVAVRGGHRRRADQPDDPSVPRQLAFDRDHRDLDPARHPGLDRDARGVRRDAQHHDPGRPRAGGRHPGRRRHGHHREHQLASRAGQGGRDRHHGRCAADRDAGLRLAALHLHRLRADVLPRGRRPLPVRADGRGGDVRDGLLVHPVAHPGADDGELPAEAARRPRAWREAADAQSAGPVPARLRGALRALPGRLPRPAGHGAGQPYGVHHLLHGLRAGVVRAGADARPQFLPLGRCRPDPDACPRPGRHPGRGDRQPVRRHPEGDPRDHPVARDRDHGRQCRHAGQRHQSDLQQYRRDRPAGRRHPDQADRGSWTDRALRGGAAPAASRALSRRHLLLPAGRHHQPDPEFRRALADRHPGADVRSRRRTSSMPTSCWPVSAPSRASSTRASSSRARRRSSPSISTARAPSMSG